MKVEEREILMQRYNFGIGYLTALANILEIGGNFEKCFEDSPSVEVYQFMMNVYNMAADRTVICDLFEEQQKLIDVSKLEDCGTSALLNAIKEVDEDNIEKSLKKVREAFRPVPSVSNISRDGNANSDIKRFFVGGRK